MKPSLASSASRRSSMAISVGHFIAMEPSSVGKLWTGRFTTRTTDSTPRIWVPQP